MEITYRMTDSNEKPKSNEVARASAEAVSAIDFLVKQEPFQQFLAYFENRSKQLADDILNNNSLTDQERENLRQQRIALVEVLSWPKDQREAHVRVLSQYGFKPGDGLEIGL
jgi:hypothetical protein